MKMLTVAEINKELRELADYNVRVYLDMVYDEYEIEMYENGNIRWETDRFYDEEAVFYAENS